MTDRRARLLIPVLAAVILTAAAPTLPVGAQGGDGRPLPTVAQEVAHPVAREQTFELPFAASHIAVHWPGQPNAQLQVAFSRDGGAFTQRVLVVHDDVGEQLRNGETYGSVMLASGATSVRVTSDRPIPRVSVLAMDSSAAAETGWTLGGGVAAAAVPQPSVITRAGWRADESYRFDDSGREIWERQFFPVQKLIVHHTAGVNNDPDPAATVRSIYYYHAITQGWGDIGYNFLIDEAGRVYEGRYSRAYAPGETPTGEDVNNRGVTGGHALGYNAGTFGVALLGTLSGRDATAAARDALERLLAWKAERHRIDPRLSSVYTNPIDGTQRTFRNLAGHRDVNSTACPGDTFYATLPSLRTAVASRMDLTPPAIVGRVPLATGLLPPNGTIEAVFSEPVTGVSSGSFNVRDSTTNAVVQATVTYHAATRRATIRPTAPLVAGRVYKVAASGSIRDAVGNSLPWTTWTFNVVTGGTGYTPARALIFEAATHTGIQLRADGTVISTKSAKTATSSAATAWRATLPGRSGWWFYVTDGIWRGYWVRESTYVHLR